MCPNGSERGPRLQPSGRNSLQGELASPLLNLLDPGQECYGTEPFSRAAFFWQVLSHSWSLFWRATIPSISGNASVRCPL